MATDDHMTIIQMTFGNQPHVMVDRLPKTMAGRA